MLSARRVLARLRSQHPATYIATAALVLAASDVSPADAVRAVKRAVFAQNAGSVNGIKASKSPRAGQLLPLGADAKVNPAVLPPNGVRGPRGTQGPAGPTGPQGSAGPRGPSSARVFVGPGVGLGYVAGVESTVATLANVDGGSYLLLFTSNVSARVANVRGYLICRLRLNGTIVKTTGDIVGETAGATGALDLVIQLPITRAAPFDLAVTCVADQASSGEGFAVNSPVLTALKLDSVTTG